MPKGSEEFFYFDTDGKRTDTDLHALILGRVEKFDKPIDEKIMGPIRERHRALAQQQAPRPRKPGPHLFSDRAWNEADHPRDPAGSPTGGQFTGDGGGRDSTSKPSAVDVHNLTIQDDLTFSQGKTDQDVKSLDELYDRSKTEEAGFKAGIDRLAADTGGTAIYTPPQYAEPGTTLKSRESAIRKMNTEENGDPTQLRDILRATVQHDTVQQSRGAALRFIQEQGDNIVRVKDRIVNPLQGYRDILINFRTEGGIISEVQFSPDDMLATKFGEGHKLYEQLRALQASKIADPQMIIVLQQQSVALYDAAYQRDGNGNWGKRK